jgi:hypothetical protein
MAKRSFATFTGEEFAQALALGPRKEPLVLGVQHQHQVPTSPFDKFRGRPLVQVLSL